MSDDACTSLHLLPAVARGLAQRLRYHVTVMARAVVYDATYDLAQTWRQHQDYRRTLAQCRREMPDHPMVATANENLVLQRYIDGAQALLDKLQPATPEELAALQARLRERFNKTLRVVRP